MQEQLTQELLKILQSLEILSPTSFSFAKTAVSVADVSKQQSSDFIEEKHLVDQLMGRLYFHCYCRKFEGVITDEWDNPTPDEDFVRQLSEANTTREHFDRGWSILYVLPTGHYIVQKNGLIRTVSEGEFISHEPRSVPLGEGMAISICCPKESTTMHRGFYYIFGEAISDQQDDDDLLKFYWNIRADGARKLVRLLTQRLNRFQIPFRLKCLNSSAAYKRADAAVLYFNRRFYPLGVQLLADVYRAVEEHLEANTPLFSKRLADGLGLAEEPGNGESFGQQRCRIVAEGIWNAYKLNLKADPERLGEVIKQFEINGLSFERPYLNPGSIDQYDFSFPQAAI